MFDSSNDTSQWAYENTPTISEKPIVTYLNSYQNATGILCLEFSKANQGVKMTLGQTNWLPSQPGKWYTVRMNYCRRCRKVSLKRPPGKQGQRIRTGKTPGIPAWLSAVSWPVQDRIGGY